jgi:hypothetical protein
MMPARVSRIMGRGIDRVGRIWRRCETTPSLAAVNHLSLLLTWDRNIARTTKDPGQIASAWRADIGRTAVRGWDAILQEIDRRGWEFVSMVAEQASGFGHGGFEVNVYRLLLRSGDDSGQ